MIFVTVGTQHAFPRLVAGVQRARIGLNEEIVAQVGDDPARYHGMEVHRSLDPEDFESICSKARVIVAHAGIGTVLTARRLQKPLVVLPRRVDLDEDVNDHQIATALRLHDFPGIYVAKEACDIAPLLRSEYLAASSSLRSPSVDGLIEHLRFVISMSSIRR